MQCKFAMQTYEYNNLNFCFDWKTINLISLKSRFKYTVQVYISTILYALPKIVQKDKDFRVC